MQVSASAILFMAISIVLSILLPIGAVVWLAARKKIKLGPVLWGVLLFVVFAIILEGQGLHRLVLGSFPQLQSYPYLFAVYAGLAAGLFEETARLIGFKWLIRVREDENPYTGIAYGLGHGGIEAILLGGMASISNLIFALMVNANAVPAGLEAIAQQLATTPSYLFLITGVERVLAMTIHLSLSMIVLKAVTDRKWGYYVLAIGLHTLINFPAGLYQAGFLQDMLLIEGITAVLTVAVALLAWQLYRKKENTPWQTAS
jgi:uncharacterized membrane protein YhfC